MKEKIFREPNTLGPKLAANAKTSYMSYTVVFKKINKCLSHYSIISSKLEHQNYENYSTL